MCRCVLNPATNIPYEVTWAVNEAGMPYVQRCEQYVPPPQQQQQQQETQVPSMPQLPGTPASYFNVESGNSARQ